MYSNQKLLNGIMKLGDMTDVEEFCHIQARTYLRSHNIYIQPHEYEDLIAYLISMVWELYDRKWNRKDSFTGYASYITPKRVTDYFRQRWGRNREKLAFESTPLSQLANVESTSSEYDQADSRAALRGILT